MPSKIEKLSHARVVCTLEIPSEEQVKAEERALKNFAEHVRIDGFRAGNAPAHMIRERVPQDDLLKETIHQALPSVLPQALEESKANPIIPPKVSIVKTEPLTIAITFVGRPEVKVSKPEKITVEKKEILPVGPKDVDAFLGKILGPEGKEIPVDRAATTGDAVVLDIDVTVSGASIAELKEEKLRTVLGASDDLLPGIAAAISGMKKGETKTVDIALGEDLEQRDVRGKKGKAKITLHSIAEVKLPELTKEFLQSRFGVEKEPAAFRKELEEMITRQRTQIEHRRREDAFFDAIRAATKVELAPELLQVETEELIHNLDQRLKEQKITAENWLKSIGKEWKQVMSEMEEVARKRLTLRFGLEEVMAARKIEVTDEEVQAAMAELAMQGGDASEESNRAQATWMRKVRKLVDSATA